MKIFLSYASEQHAIAEPVAHTLRARGHLVFFDKTDLPPSDSYDEQIMLAIAESDLLVFLISPQSVTPGRYTLTELKFAREKWSSARGRVLPVVAEFTPSADIPPYLTSIQMLTPEGNLAAEVAAVVDQIIPTPRPSRVLPIAITLALISGVISGLVAWKNAAWWESISTSVEGLVGEGASIVLGPLSSATPYVFTLVIATLLVLWDRRPVSRAILVLPVVAGAWICAYWLAFWIVGGDLFGLDSVPEASQCQTVRADDAQLQFACKEIAKYKEQLDPLFQRMRIVILLFAGLSGGFIGALIIGLGLGRLSRRLNSLDAVALIILVGTAAGALLAALGFKNEGLSGSGLMLLFVVWQPAVAAAIAWQFTKPAPREMRH